MQDLSHLAVDSIWCTSQAAGNMTSSNAKAMTAPGSTPVDPLPPSKDQGEPDVEMGAPMRAGTSGKPPARASTADWHPGAPAWEKTTTPGIVRVRQEGT